MSIIKDIQNRKRQLDELSRGTLSSYITKARFSKSHHEKKAIKAERQIKHPNKNLPTYGHAKTSEHPKVKEMHGHDKKAKRREIGMDKAADKLSSVREDVEQIDELSKNTVRSYISKSVDSQIDISHHRDGTPKKSLTSDERRKRKNRSNGEMTGYNKLNVGLRDPKVKATNEDVEQIDELSKETLNNYAIKASHSQQKIRGDAKLEFHSNGGAAHENGKFLGKTDKWKKLVTKSRKRSEGVSKAISKLSEEEQLDERNDENKVKKNLHAVKVGYKKSIHHLLDKQKTHKGGVDGAIYHQISTQSNGSSKQYNLKAAADRFKARGRKHLRGDTHEEVELSPIIEQIIDLIEAGQNILHKKGRPKKDRHEDGKIVND